jgi:hypothetical protein
VQTPRNFLALASLGALTLTLANAGAQQAPTFVAAGYSSSAPASATLPDAPGQSPAPYNFHHEPITANYTPFVSYAVAFRIGSGGIGGEVSTPLNKHLELRGGAQFFSYSTNIVANGLDADGTITMQNGFVAVDYFPFHNQFRISPGITLHNDNHVAFSLDVPAGQTFTLGNQDYTSQPGDPITGSGHILFGSEPVVPRFTVGWGNPFPRNGGHWAFPVDVGFEVTTRPTVQLSLAGSGCDSQGCGPIDDPDNQANIQQEITNLENDLAPLRFYPIVSFGVSYRIGH